MVYNPPLQNTQSESRWLKPGEEALSVLHVGKKVNRLAMDVTHRVYA